MKSQKYTLRKAAESDYEFIYQTKKEAYKTYVEINFGSWDDSQQREYFNAFMESCGDDAYIIAMGGQDIGFYNGQAIGSLYEIGNICIIPSHQNQGIGTALLNDILEQNADKEIHLQYFKQNPVGKLYERLGFSLTGETAHHYQMIKEISAQYTTEDNAMSLLELINNRHSYRGEYKNTPVPREDLIKIMEAGLAAPSGCNKQTTSLIAVDDPEILSKLREVIQPPVGETAPAIICVLTQRINAYRDKCYATHDYSAAIENMLLAIVALGYQSCWYEGHITDEDRIGDQMAKILDVPEGYELVCFLPVGIAKTEPKAPKKKEFAERAWFNGFKAK